MTPLMTQQATIYEITNVSDFLGPITIQLNGGVDWFRADQFELAEGFDDPFTLDAIQ